MPDVVVDLCRPAEAHFKEKLTVRGEKPPSKGPVRARPQKLHIRQCYTQLETETPPTHVLIAQPGFIEVWDLAGNKIRTLTTPNNGGSVFVDYAEERIYYAQENAAGNTAVSYINFDGTDEAELRDTGVAASGEHGLTYDPARDAFLISHSNRVFEIAKDGSSQNRYDIGVTGHQLAAGLENGTNWVLFDNNALHLRAFPSSLINTIAGTYIKGAIDPSEEKIFFGNTGEGLKACDFDLSNVQVLDTLNTQTTSRYGLSIYKRWVYYTPTVGDWRRMSLDDYNTTEDLGSIPDAVANAYPWWEGDVVTALTVGLVVNNTGHTSTTNIKSAVENLGHTVTVIDEADLTTHDFSGYDVVLAARGLSTQQLCDDFKSNVIDEGIPVILGTIANGLTAGTGRQTPATRLNLTGTWEIISNSAGGDENVVSDNTHDITDSYSANEELTLYSTANFMSAVDTGENIVGSAILTGDPDESAAGQTSGLAIPVGTNDLNGDPTTVRIFVWGDLYAGQGTYTNAGRSLLKRILDWVTA